MNNYKSLLFLVESIIIFNVICDYTQKLYLKINNFHFVLKIFNFMMHLDQ